ncbi:protein ORF84 [Anguillid herpesvirus 1]|uniref:Protein ORF84 n=1 Tax=Anguillid herpesvirus 1 TaxID=150286 RepID=A0A1J0REJ6_9VIRU|nr:protein ORF84 [Anguillid herpesvirus 1]ADA57847.1 protein ORF84 [Anguillid herpesvirus 1]APD76246.1 ORF84 [Anguillid herpesvirus 1]QRM16377.1 protein ORF84 [Anguillid herpesvirus 1]QRM16505.1 protein ORF84 [Anguillid herpesvirus 1]QRM16636.1 protein ORF84 [Anguillid herpesvirus 1]
MGSADTVTDFGVIPVLIDEVVYLTMNLEGCLKCWSGSPHTKLKQVFQELVPERDWCWASFHMSPTLIVDCSLIVGQAPVAAASNIEWHEGWHRTSRPTQTEDGPKSFWILLNHLSEKTLYLKCFRPGQTLHYIIQSTTLFNGEFSSQGKRLVLRSHKPAHQDIYDFYLL